MKLLMEQKEKLEEEIERLKEEEKEFRNKRSLYMDYESNDIAGRARSVEAHDYSTAITASTNLRQKYEKILKEAEFVTQFNNEQVEIGTTFILQFEDGAIETLTMVETNIGVSSTDGYITAYSPLGQKVMHQKVTGRPLQIEENDVSFKILEILPKEDLEKEKLEKEEEKLQVENEKSDLTPEPRLKPVVFVPEKPVKKEIPPVSYFKTEHVSKNYSHYRKSLENQQEINEKARNELIIFDNLTFCQKQYLSNYLRAVVSRRNQAVERGELQACNFKICSLTKALRKKIIRPQVSEQAEIGQQVLLEVTKNHKKEILDCELIPKAYGEENQNGFLSIRTAVGFFAYHAKMGDTVTLKYPAAQTIRVAQFGIHQDKLILPLSANLSKMTEKEEFEVERRMGEIQRAFPTMTISQKALLDYELEKLGKDASSPYQEYLCYLKEQIQNGNLHVQTQEELDANQGQVGLGSQVSYLCIENNEPKLRTKELIWNAYTVESNEDCIEMQSVLGASLYGKHVKDKIQIPYQGQIIEGQIVSISNRPYLQKNYTNLPNAVYMKTMKK